MDERSAQFSTELRDAVTHALRTRRPLLHHLNADTSWLLQIPAFVNDVDLTRRHHRNFFNILVDPWLSGSQSDVASWFSNQWHAIKPRYSSITAVEELVHDIELLTGGLRLDAAKQPYDPGNGPDAMTFIDAVVISHEFTDHCHKQTLLEVHSDVPVFATKKAVDLIKSWNHFALVQEVLPLSPGEPDWRNTSTLPLPDWLGIGRLVNESDAFYYHSALMISFASTKPEAECVIYTPHGISPAVLSPLSVARPTISTLALLHGTHDVSIAWGQQLNLGARNGLAAQRTMRAKYWIGTHDEVKHGGGLVGLLLRRRVLTVEEAVREEAKAIGAEEKDALEGVVFVEMGNGESRVLE